MFNKSLAKKKVGSFNSIKKKKKSKFMNRIRETMITMKNYLFMALKYIMIFLTNDYNEKLSMNSIFLTNSNFLTPMEKD